MGHAARQRRHVLLDLAAGRGVPLHRQIYEELRRQILDGRLARGTRLPSMRRLAVDLRVSRSTVVQAFEQLRAEGYIDAVSRGGTRISHKLPDALVRAERPRTSDRRAPTVAAPSRRAAAIASARPQFTAIFDRPPRAFRTSVPALDIFPVDLWGRLMARHAGCQRRHHGSHRPRPAMPPPIAKSRLSAGSCKGSYEATPAQRGGPYQHARSEQSRPRHMPGVLP